MADDNTLEALVLKEGIVSATGLTSQNLQVGLRGDPSLRETAYYRQRYQSRVDAIYTQLAPHLEELLLNRSTYRLYIGFNNGEVRTASVFDPFRQEIHDADHLADPAYMERHFPIIAYTDKIEAIRTIYDIMAQNGLYDRLPDYWQRIIKRRNQHWNAMSEANIKRIIPTLKILRDIQEYYLRTVTICIVQDLVHFQFNCDGTQLVTAKNYHEFLQENL